MRTERQTTGAQTSTDAPNGARDSRFTIHDSRTKPGREARRRAWGEDEHSPQWRGEACRTCRFWTGCVCLDDWEAYRSCPVGRPQETTGVGRSPTAPAKLPSLQTAKLPKPGPSGHGVHLFDW